MEEIRITCKSEKQKEDVLDTLGFAEYHEHIRLEGLPFLHSDSLRKFKGLTFTFKASSAKEVKWWLRRYKGLKIQTKKWSWM